MAPDPRADGWCMENQRPITTRRVAYLNVVLTAIAVLLALLLVDRQGVAGWLAPPGARAQASAADDPQSSAQSLVSASEQRKLMIAELKRLAGKLDRIEAKLNAGLNVKVTEMPAAKGDGK